MRLSLDVFSRFLGVVHGLHTWTIDLYDSIPALGMVFGVLLGLRALAVWSGAGVCRLWDGHCISSGGAYEWSVVYRDGLGLLGALLKTTLNPLMLVCLEE